MKPRELMPFGVPNLRPRNPNLGNCREPSIALGPVITAALIDVASREPVGTPTWHAPFPRSSGEPPIYTLYTSRTLVP